VLIRCEMVQGELRDDYIVFSIEGREIAHDEANDRVTCKFRLSQCNHVFGQVKACDVRVWKGI
jgi:hypothetical protein